MKYLKRFNESKESFETDPIKVREILDSIDYGLELRGRGFTTYHRPDGSELPIPTGRNIVINPDGSVDLNQSFIAKLPTGTTRLPIKFGKVYGSFELVNGELTTLEGSPYECLQFRVSGNMKDLVGCPKKVVDIWIEGGELTSLEGCPRFVNNLFWIQAPKLTNLKGCPKEVGGNCWIRGSSLTTLIGAPETVGSEFRILGGSDKLTSLEGLPRSFQSISIYGRRTIKDPRVLKDYSHFPFRMEYHNEPFFELVDLFVPLTPSGHPKVPHISFGGSILSHGNPKFDNSDGAFYKILSQGEKRECLKRFIDSLEYNYIRGTSEDPHINLFRFKEALDELGIEFRDWSHGDVVNALGKAPMRKTLKNYQFRDDEGRVVDFDGNPI